MRLAIACDHGGYALKMKLLTLLPANIYEIKDFGCYDEQSVDYPDLAFAAAEAVADGTCEFGIVICTTGIGMCICANKVKGIRCALCTSVYMAEMTRRHNDANMLALGGHTVEADTALAIVERFLHTDLDGGRHGDRVRKISDYEQHI